MSSAGEGRIEPNTDNFERRLKTHHPLADGNNVGVIVLPAQPGGFDIPAQYATDTFDAIGGDGFAVAGAAQHHAAFEFTARYGFRHRPDEQGIIHEFLRVRPEIRDVVPQALQQFLDIFLVPESGVV